MEHPLSDMMTNTMSKIKDMIDVNTVVGSPITTPGGVTIIPVTKVSIGYGGGGSDFATKNMPVDVSDYQAGVDWQRLAAQARELRLRRLHSLSSAAKMCVCSRSPNQPPHRLTD